MKKYNIFILVFIAFIFSCRPTDEDITPVLGECEDVFPDFDTVVVFGDLPIEQRRDKTYPQSVSYNPLNNNELIITVRKKKASGDELDLYLFDRTKKCKNKILDSRPSSTSSIITENGWIAFGKNGALWKIKTDGSQLTQLTNFLPIIYTLSPDGSSLLFRANQQLQLLKNGEIKPITEVYPLSGTFMNGRWDYSGTKLYLEHATVTGGYLGMYDTVTQIYQEYPYTQFNSNVEPLREPNKVIWYNEEGISILNVETGESTLLRSICESRSYTSLRTSPDGTKIIGIRHDARHIRKDIYEWDIYIIEMNIDGTNERRIDF